MSDLLNINRGFESMLPIPKNPEGEEAAIEKTKEISIEFVVLNCRFKFSINFSRE